LATGGGCGGTWASTTVPDVSKTAVVKTNMRIMIDPLGGKFRRRDYCIIIVAGDCALTMPPAFCQPA
jgi:hypothetical protein